MKKRTLLWLLLFPILAAVTLWAVVSFTKGFSWADFRHYLSIMSPRWLAAAIAAMVSYVFWEGFSLRFICSRLGYTPPLRHCLCWSAADIFFSAITPSATGGQPAAALLMLRDKVPGHMCTVSLLLNLIQYTLSILVIGPVAFLLSPKLAAGFHPVSLWLVGIGFVIQLLLSALFILLMLRPGMVLWVADRGLRLLQALRLLRNGDKRRASLAAKMPVYYECAQAVKHDWKLLLGSFLFNFLQRFSMLLVPVCVYLGTGGRPQWIPRILAVQSCVVLGSNAAPLPGAMGLADYLFLDGYSHLVHDTVSMELLSRGISFYGCFLLCGLIVLAGRILAGIQRKREVQ